MSQVTRSGDGTEVWWRNLDAREAPADAAPSVEFPHGAVQSAPSRRDALRLIGASLALGAAGCGRLPGHIVPYVEMPEGLVPGRPMHFATSLLLGGYAQPVVVESHEGRPTKIEGNATHSASRGATDAFAQAAILSLYEPGRSKVVRYEGQIASQAAFDDAIVAQRPRWQSGGGAGMRLLTGRVTSPTLSAQIGKLKDTYPGLVWHRWEPLNDDNVHAGAELAFGERLAPRYHLDKASVIIALDADLLGAGPHQVLHATRFAGGRRARSGSSRLTRVLAAEPSLTLTGAAADARLPFARSRIWQLAEALGAVLGSGRTAELPDDNARAWIERARREIGERRDSALIVAGAAQPPFVHAMAAWMNAQLGVIGTTVTWHTPIESDPVDHRASIVQLVQDMSDGKVDTLVMLGCNPAYTAPADLGFIDALQKVPMSVHVGLHEDETSNASRWHVPALHALEGWSDARAPDGTVDVIQPLITPLYNGRSEHEVLALLAGSLNPDGREIVMSHWRETSGVPDFEAFWRQTLHDGYSRIVPHEPAATSRPRLPAVPADTPASAGWEIAFDHDEAVWDGRFSENAWLQELPRPVGKEVWGNAATISPADAARLGVEDGDVVRISTERHGPLEIAIQRAPGQAAQTIGVRLGYGRAAGFIASGIGSDTYKLRTHGHLWVAAANVAKTGRHVDIARTQNERSMHGRDIVRTQSLATLGPARHAPEPMPVSVLFPHYPAGQYSWGMVIDQSVCIGCNACVVACQAENNVPVVGPDEVRVGRDMHWLRVDLYFKGQPEDPDALFQPVPCMHCEKAPCEPVCPVEASVHDSEGLNLQVYNRCVGTRFCQANCPYKVRHFNFFGYGDGQEYKNLGAPMVHAAHNPDVSVRARGVMEKCTYCVQRISSARRDAEKASRSIPDGTVVPACAQACPTSAITFGDLQNADSHIVGLKRQPHEYGLMAHLGTRPRTTYLARVRDEPARPVGGVTDAGPAGTD